MTAASFREAGLEDLDALLPLVRQFYAHFGYPYAEDLKRRAFAQLLAAPALGRVFLVSLDGALVGYAVVAFSFSLEYEGSTAFLDELFILPAARGRGIGSAVIRHVADQCRAHGVNALHLESEAANVAAARLYARLGFRDYGRHLMTRILSAVGGPKP